MSKDFYFDLTLIQNHVEWFFFRHDVNFSTWYLLNVVSKDFYFDLILNQHHVKWFFFDAILENTSWHQQNASKTSSSVSKTSSSVIKTSSMLHQGPEKCSKQANSKKKLKKIQYWVENSEFSTWFWILFSQTIKHKISICFLRNALFWDKKQKIWCHIENSEFSTWF